MNHIHSLLLKIPYQDFLGLIILFGGTTRIGLNAGRNTPYYSHTVNFCKIEFSIFQKHAVLYHIHVALRPASRVAQSAVIGQHSHSVSDWLNALRVTVNSDFSSLADVKHGRYVI